MKLSIVFIFDAKKQLKVSNLNQKSNQKLNPKFLKKSTLWLKKIKNREITSGGVAAAVTTDEITTKEKKLTIKEKILTKIGKIIKTEKNLKKVQNEVVIGIGDTGGSREMSKTSKNKVQNFDQKSKKIKDFFYSEWMTTKKLSPMIGSQLKEMVKTTTLTCAGYSAIIRCEV